MYTLLQIALILQPIPASVPWSPRICPTLPSREPQAEEEEASGRGGFQGFADQFCRGLS